MSAADDVVRLEKERNTTFNQFKQAEFRRDDARRAVLSSARNGEYTKMADAEKRDSHASAECARLAKELQKVEDNLRDAKSRANREKK